MTLIIHLTLHRGSSITAQEIDNLSRLAHTRCNGVRQDHRDTFGRCHSTACNVQLSVRKTSR
jgi:hypothetical protein